MGMNRTGVETARLYDFVKAAVQILSPAFSGLHCYDGHVHTTDLTQRGAEVSAMTQAIAAVIDRLEQEGIEVPMIIAGGSPSFPCHAANPRVFLSPGTVFLWDSGYAQNLSLIHIWIAAKCACVSFTPGITGHRRITSAPALSSAASERITGSSGAPVQRA